MSTGGALPVYFELSWAILSSFSLLNVVAGFLIVGITGFSSLWVVPVVCSTASAIANGLCYIAYYSDYSLNSRLPAAILADIFWCIQEAGLSFYSYQILRRFLRGRSRIIFLSLFWTLMASIFSFRLTILISRAQDLIGGGNSRQYLINHLHNGYFGSIAIVEILSSIFLLRIFAEGKRSSQVLATGNNLFKQLTMSTELRVSSLALVGIGRAVAYSFQVEAQSATSVASQFDRFFFTLENYFPVVMFLDLLATRVVHNEYGAHAVSSTRRRYAKPDTVTMELNRMNEDARQGMDRQTFVLIEGKGEERNSNSRIAPKGISKTTTISVDRGGEPAHAV